MYSRSSAVSKTLFSSSKSNSARELNATKERFRVGEVTRHPAEPQSHQQRLLLGLESGQVKDAFSAEHVAIIALIG